MSEADESVKSLREMVTAGYVTPKGDQITLLEIADQRDELMKALEEIASETLESWTSRTVVEAIAKAK